MIKRQVGKSYGKGVSQQYIEAIESFLAMDY